MSDTLNVGKVSCICITNNRVDFLLKAIQCFNEQYYGNKELLIFYDASDFNTRMFALPHQQQGNVQQDILSRETVNSIMMETHIRPYRAPGPNIIFVQLENTGEMTLGEKRNLATRYSDGEFICVWDDDDCYSSDRLWHQISALQQTGLSACTIRRLYVYDSINEQSYITSPRREGWEGSLLCKKREMAHYAARWKQEDTPVLLELYNKGKLFVIDAPELYIYIIHASNTCDPSHFSKIKTTGSQLSEQDHHYIKGLCRVYA